MSNTPEQLAIEIKTYNSYICEIPEHFTVGKEGPMDFVIRKLTSDLAEDYAHFFDVTPHDVNKDEMKCYCIIWRSDASYANAGHWFDTREERRSRAIGYVKNGIIRGYLAYLGDEIVGWCNTNEECRLGIEYLRNEWPIEHYPPQTKVKPIFCFVIKPEFQRKGAATQLVKQICEDAANEGFDYVEAYVNEHFVSTIHDFRGPLKMYEKCGFVRCAERNGKVVMRKKLK